MNSNRSPIRHPVSDQMALIALFTICLAFFPVIGFGQCWTWKVLENSYGPGFSVTGIGMAYDPSRQQIIASAGEEDESGYQDTLWSYHQGIWNIEWESGLLDHDDDCNRPYWLYYDETLSQLVKVSILSEYDGYYDYKGATFCVMGASGQWERIAGMSLGRSYRSHLRFAYDSGRRRLIIANYSIDYHYFNKLSEFDGAATTSFDQGIVLSDGILHSFEVHQMGYDPIRAKIIMNVSFAWYDSLPEPLKGDKLNTISYDGNELHLLVSDHSKMPNQGEVTYRENYNERLVFYPGLQSLVYLYSGQDENHQNMWVFEQDHWNRLGVSQYPELMLNGAAIEFDPSENELLMYGGIDSISYQAIRNPYVFKPYRHCRPF